MNVQVALTNKVAVTPVRGAGQPQGVFAMERLLDSVAREFGLDRAEVRRRNLVPAHKMPYQTGLKTRGGMPVVLDTGDYPRCQQDALARAGWDGFAPASKPRATKVATSTSASRTSSRAWPRAVRDRDRACRAVRPKLHRLGAVHMGKAPRPCLAQIVASTRRRWRTSPSRGRHGHLADGDGGFD